MKLGLRRHGDTHHPEKGSDPIPGLSDGIRFDIDNEGGWLWIVARGGVPDTDDAIVIQAVDDGEGNSGDITVDADGTIAVSGDDIALTAGTAVMQGDGGDGWLISSHVIAHLGNGETFVIEDHLNSPLVTYTG